MSFLIRRFRLAALALVPVLALAAALAAPEARSIEEGDKLFEEKNYAEAEAAYRNWLADNGAGKDADRAWHAATERVTCLLRLGKYEEGEAAAREVVKLFAATFREARAERFLGNLLIVLPHEGTKQGGTWRRGVHGQGIYTTRFGKDRDDAVTHLERARELAAQWEGKGIDRAERIGTIFDLSDAVTRFGPYDLAYWRSWNEEDDSDGTVGAEEDEGERHWRQPEPEKGISVDLAGNPTFEPRAETYTAGLATTPKMKYLLHEAAALDETEERKFEGESIYRRAMLARARYGPDRVARGRGYGVPQPENEPKLATLGDDEVLALAGGKLRVVKLPTDENVLALLADVSDRLPKSGIADAALFATGCYRQSRGQFPAALAAYGKLTTEYPKSSYLSSAQAEATRILMPEVVIGPGGVQLAGDAAFVDLTYRNATAIKLNARRIDLEAAVRDVLAMFDRDDPQANNWAFNDMASYLLHENKWLGYVELKPCAEWTFTGTPREDHGHTEARVPAPLPGRGCYIVEARTGDARPALGFALLEDLAIVEKALATGRLTYVCDARTGKPVAGATVESFEMWSTWVRNDDRHHHHLKRAEAKSSETGIVEAKHRCPSDQSCQPLTIAKTEDGRRAFAGLGWSGRYSPSGTESGWRSYVVTDRPVYRPGQKVQAKLMTRNLKDGAFREPRRRKVDLWIYDPRGQKVKELNEKTTETGGLAFDLDLDPKAPLGMYSIQVKVDGEWSQLAGAQFRVEEYKKPEFEVTVEPGAAEVRLGEKIAAKIVARYHFGGPVSEAVVKYRVFRERFTMSWFEPGEWDWLYGRGYGFCRYGAPWFEWWGRWGWLMGGAPERELLFSGEAPIGSDGTVKVDIDTAPALRVHGDSDHRYVIEADVRDASRRTISGEGSVLATRQALYAFVETDRGFYRPGETVFAKVRTVTPDGRPVAAEGRWWVARVLYTGQNADKIVEEPGEKHAAKTDAEGRLAVSIEALKTGQYRFVFETRDQTGAPVVGTTLVWVDGQDLEGRVYKFNELELVTDKRTYTVGETAHVLVRTAAPGATLLFAEKVDSGTILKYRVLEVAARTQVIDVPIEKGDVPNRFLEATVVRNGRVHQEARELYVPPQASVVAVDVRVDKPALSSVEGAVYKPGEEGTIEVTTKTPEGAPIATEVVLSVFDKSVLQIQPELQPDIRAYYWARRRWHNPSYASNLGRQMRGSSHPDAIEYPHHWTVLPGWQGSFGSRWIDWHAAKLKEQEGAGGRYDEFGARFGRDGRELEEKQRAAAPEGVPAAGGELAKAADSATRVPSAPPPGQPRGPSGGGSGEKEGERGDSAGAPLKTAKVRSKFADTALWLPVLTTSEEGKASAKVKFPENLTTWKIRAHGMTEETRVGSAAIEVLTTKNLLVRLAAPRFFVERDEVVLSAIVMNRLKTAKKARVSLAVPVALLEPFEGQALTRDVEVPAGGEARVDWRVRARGEGLAAVKVEALTDEESDAMQLELPVRVHGSARQLAKAGSVRRGEEKIAFTIPAELRPDESRLRVRVSPSLAGAMLEALPYLLDYPYGCLEQTLNRFLPAVVTAKTLGDAGVDLEEIGRARARLNPLDSDDPTRRRERFGYDSEHLPVFSKSDMDRIVAAGLERIYRMQAYDGGFGWWAGDSSNPYLTALALDGLLTAIEADVQVRQDVVDRALAYLAGWVAEDMDALRKHPHALPSRSFATYVLARRKKQNEEILELLMQNRDHLGAYGLSLLARTYAALDRKDRGQAVLRNLLQRVEKDDEVETAWIRTETEGWWWWWNDKIETNASALRAILALEPASELAPRLVKWLLQNRHNGFYWRSTKDTATVIAAFADYLRASKELSPELDVTIQWDDGPAKKVRITRDNLFSFDAALDLAGSTLTPGAHTLTIARSGKGSLYYSAYLSYFTLEEDVPAAGLDLRVERKYWKLEEMKRSEATTDARGAAMSEDRLRYKRIALASGDAVRSGDLIEVELLLKSKNDFDFLAFEDPKPAGCEPVALRSGGRYGEVCSNMELRDEKVVFFATRLDQGDHRITYRLRAEAPGKFHALPTQGFMMYAPEIRGSAAEMRLGIEEAREIR